MLRSPACVDRRPSALLAGRTCRIAEGDVIPPEAEEAMRNALSSAKDLDGWLAECKSSGLGKPLTLNKEWKSADECHANFRGFCKFGHVELVRRLATGPPASAEFWLRRGSQKYNETGLVLAAKYGQQEATAVLAREGGELTYVANGSVSLVRLE